MLVFNFDVELDSHCHIVYTKHAMTRPWTKEEVNKLMELINSGKKRKEIAQILGRSLKSVEAKLRDIRKKEMEHRKNSGEIEAKTPIDIENTPLDNNQDENSAVIVYKKFLKKFLQKDSLPEKEFNNLTKAVEEYYLKTKNLNGAILLLETIMEAGKY